MDAVAEVGVAAAYNAETAAAKLGNSFAWLETFAVQVCPYRQQRSAASRLVAVDSSSTLLQT